MHLTRLLVIPAIAVTGLLVGVACSYVYEVHFVVRLASGVSTTTGALVLEIEDPHGAEQRVVLPLTSSANPHTGTVSICCAPNPTVNLYAFIDLDGDQLRGPTEPFGAYAHNPVQLGQPLTAPILIQPAGTAIPTASAAEADSE